MILRKIRSAARILLNDPQPVRKVSRLVSRNGRLLRLILSNRRPFFYRTPDRQKYVCLPESATSVDMYIERAGDEIERRLIRLWLRPGDHVWDLGANIGSFSALFANCVGPAGSVLAVEPGKETHRHLIRTLELLRMNQVQTLGACIWDKEGHVAFGGDPESSDVQHRVIQEADENAPTVRATTLDELWRQCSNEKRPAFIKMDIEGAEPRALAAASLLLEERVNSPAWLIEIYTTGLHRMGFLPAHILEHFPADRFELFFVNFSHPNPMPEFPTGRIFPLIDPKAQRWPNHSNLIVLPRTGVFADRRTQLAALLP